MKHYLSLVKFSHTVFALPFALLAFSIGVAERGAMDWRILLYVVLCMVFARNAAMSFNRWLDRDIDAANPRTRSREIPAGIISPQAALLFVVINCALFAVTTWFINPLCFWLSPVALAVVLGYSFTKRFTWLCHLVLGLGLSLAPVGAYLAVTGHFHWVPVLYGAAVLLWVAGFDVIYALQDEVFDQEQSLYSMPAAFGKARALRLSELMHLGTAGLMMAAAWRLQQHLPGHTSWLLWAATGLFLGLLIYQHLLVKPQDLRRVNMAFFTTNGIASLSFGVLVILDLWR
ncbi:MAG TPA: UbiA-like polyprenyltransferase [Saprospiraceae bacterium]|nr:UbiA-like polyprenyltransferase [Saprospiraceae bacterium]HND87060.1 UbiA-like polyprenyltransferase [Saprospiraceae bacterium]HNG90508.1 UbiA-like polyprenyltransferase [Saprospiraceae bacterium]